MADARVSVSEAGDRAVHGRLGHRVGPDAQTLGDPRPEAFEHDVRARDQRPAELRVALEVAEDRLLAGVQALVPLGRHVANGIAVGALEADHPRPQAQQLTARERPGEIAREVDDERSGEGLQGRRKLPAATRSNGVSGIPEVAKRAPSADANWSTQQPKRS